MPLTLITMSSANSVPSTTSLSKPVPPSTETGAFTLYDTSSSPPPARMSSGRAVEKPRPMIGRATPSVSSGMMSSSHIVGSAGVAGLKIGAPVMCASALLQTPSPLLSLRKAPGAVLQPSPSYPGLPAGVHFAGWPPPAGTSTTGYVSVSGSASRLMSSKSQSSSASALVSQTAASANAR